ncbi:MAG: hypothetical protein FWC46_06900 [Actinomycetia bacterium]|nr:hypothetical protein [Actinomycetes bacterium]
MRWPASVLGRSALLFVLWVPLFGCLVAIGHFAFHWWEPWTFPIWVGLNGLLCVQQARLLTPGAKVFQRHHRRPA